MPNRIAILEDDPRQRAAVAAELGCIPGCVVVGEFGRVQDLRKALPGLRCDLVLLDVQLPDGTGIEALRFAKSLPAPVPRCIMLTVLADSVTLFEALKAGADGYLVKRGDPKALVERLRELESGEVPMSPAVARRVLDHFRGVSASPSGVDDLTASEREVLTLLAQGHTNQEIAESRRVALATVRTQLTSVYQKLQVRNRTEAVAWFHRAER